MLHADCHAALCLRLLCTCRYLMSVRVQEEYTLDKAGAIVRLQRTMANAAQAKLAASA
jgi:hypothetical protein